jgi:hypothetical protein
MKPNRDETIEYCIDAIVSACESYSGDIVITSLENVLDSYRNSRDEEK